MPTRSPSPLTRAVLAAFLATLLQPLIPLSSPVIGAAPVTLNPAADAWVDSSQPNSNLGSNNRLKVRVASKSFQSLLRFTVAGIGPIASARLRLFVADGSADGGTIFRSSGSWTESGVTWANRPVSSGNAIASVAPATAKTWVEIDLTGVISGDGTYDFVITGGISDAVGYHSRESKPAQRPQLVLTPAVSTLPPSNRALPTVSAPAPERAVHFALPGGWIGEAPIAYRFQWLRCNPDCSPIPLATTDRYQLTAEDVGSRLAVDVEATNPAGSAIARSDLTEPIPASSPPDGGDPVVAVAGDVACAPDDGAFNGGAGTATGCRQMATSDLLVGRGLTNVLVPGDTQYPVGAYADFLRSYDASWGRVNGITRPAPGNHEYGTPGAAGYFGYFGGGAGTPGSGWYSFEIGAWHVIALNSNCDLVGCDAGSAQETWLRQDLAASDAACTLAFWHHPLFSSGVHGSEDDVAPLWRALYEYGADLVMTGHDHHYERFAPQTVTGLADDDYGIRQFVVGTGGTGLRTLGAPVLNSEARNDTDFGVLDVTLHAESYSWEFMPVAGDDFADAGTGTCHAAPDGPPPPPPPPPGTDFMVSATVETAPMPHAKDSADDAAIWVHPTDPSLSTIIATDKQPGGGLAVYDLSGNQLYYYGGVAMNNVDVIQAFPLAGSSVSLAVATDRDHAVLAIYRIDPQSRGLVNVASPLIGGALGGLCTYHSPLTGQFHAFTTNGNGVVKQWRLFESNGLVDASLVRKFDVGESVEGCVTDVEGSSLYLAEEDVGVWRYGAEPGDGSQRVLVDGTGSAGHLTADVEGLTIASDTSDRYLIASSQGDNRYVMYRLSDHSFVSSFRIVASASIDGAESTDGIAVAPMPLGPLFPGGVFVAQDGDNTDAGVATNHNFKLIGWDTILAAAGV